MSHKCKTCGGSGLIDVPALGIQNECRNCPKGRNLRKERRTAERIEKDFAYMKSEQATIDQYVWEVIQDAMDKPGANEFSVFNALTDAGIKFTIENRPAA